MKHFCCWCGKIHEGECNDLKDIVEECSREFKKLIDKKDAQNKRRYDSKIRKPRNKRELY